MVADVRQRRRDGEQFAHTFTRQNAVAQPDPVLQDIARLRSGSQEAIVALLTRVA